MKPRLSEKIIFNVVLKCSSVDRHTDQTHVANYVHKPINSILYNNTYTYTRSYQCNANDVNANSDIYVHQRLRFFCCLRD